MIRRQVVNLWPSAAQRVYFAITSIASSRCNW